MTQAEVSKARSSVRTSRELANIHGEFLIRHGLVTDLEVSTTTALHATVTVRKTAGHTVAHCIIAGRRAKNPFTIDPGATAKVELAC